MAQWNSKTGLQRAKDGLCRNCGRKPQIGLVTCDFCRQIHKNKIIKLRQQLLDIYGHKCAICGQSEFNFLTLDHINNDGAKEKRIVPQNHSILRKAIKEKDSSKYQILCMNCNHAKDKYPDWFKQYSARAQLDPANDYILGQLSP